MKTEHAYMLLAGIAGETTLTIIGADRPRIDAAREALDLPPLEDGQDVAVGLDLDRARFVLSAIERGGNPESEECFDSQCPGFFAEDESAVDGRRQAFRVARCDACAQYPGDVEAARAYTAAKLLGGYVVTAWVDSPSGLEGRCLAFGGDSVNAFTHWQDAAAFANELIASRSEHDGSPYCTEVRIEQVVPEQVSCRHCGAEGDDTGGECPRCERNRDTGKAPA